MIPGLKGSEARKDKKIATLKRKLEDKKKKHKEAKKLVCNLGSKAMDLLESCREARAGGVLPKEENLEDLGHIMAQLKEGSDNDTSSGWSSDSDSSSD